jgi:RNA recognition motif-containing protein
MGLHREKKTPCGFAFVEYFTRRACKDAEELLNGKTLENRVVKFELDPGFKEGRQFGRGRGGGQVRDDFREEDDPERGGLGSLAQVGLLPSQQGNSSNIASVREQEPIHGSRYSAPSDNIPVAAASFPAPNEDDDRSFVKRGRFNDQGDRGRYSYPPRQDDRRPRNRSRDNRPHAGNYASHGRSSYPQQGGYRHLPPQQQRPMVDEFGRDLAPRRE